MVKNKFERMSKMEKKDLILAYKNTQKGKAILQRLRRIFCIGIIGLLYSVYLFISKFNDWNFSDYMLMIPLLLCSFFFILMSFKLRKQNLNHFAISKK